MELKKSRATDRQCRRPGPTGGWRAIARIAACTLALGVACCGYPRASRATVAGQEQHFSGVHCAVTTHQCSPNNGNDHLNCNELDFLDHCAYGFKENGPDVTCTAVFPGGKCTQTWVPCATWFAGTCVGVEVPDSGEIFVCEEAPGNIAKTGGTLAIQCANH